MLKKHHGIELSVTSIGRLLRQLGLSPQRPIYKAYQQDSSAVKQWLEKTYPKLFARAKKLKVTEIYPKVVDELSGLCQHGRQIITKIKDEHEHKRLKISIL